MALQGHYPVEPVKLARIGSSTNDAPAENGKNPISAGPSAEIRAGEAALVACDAASKRAERSSTRPARRFSRHSWMHSRTRMRDIMPQRSWRTSSRSSRLVEALAAERLGLELPRLLANTRALRDAVADIRRAIGR